MFMDCEVLGSTFAGNSQGHRENPFLVRHVAGCCSECTIYLIQRCCLMFRVYSETRHEAVVHTKDNAAPPGHQCVLYG
jgi:hypothetical protein